MAVALVVAAAALRLDGLHDIDLFCDEALTAEIAASFWAAGELNPFRYTRFLPDYFFPNDVMVYFPPLSYVIAAPFMALRDSVGPNIAPRLPPLLSGLLLIVLLIPAARALLGDARIGIAAAALTVCNGFHIGMSRMVLPYSLLPALLLVALLAVLRAVRRNRVLDWTGAALATAATAYVNQSALLFWPMFAVIGFDARRDRTALRRFIICMAAAGLMFAAWIVALPRAALFASGFLQTTAGYTFTAQAAKLALPYQQMLAPWPIAVAFALGLVRLSVEAVRRFDATKTALLLWLVMPGVILLTRSMWILDYHLYAVYPAVILVVAYGIDMVARALSALIGWADARARIALCAILTVGLAAVEWRFAPPAAPRAAREFGDARIVSAAAAHIRAHDRGEAVIAPVGTSEAYYLDRFVHSKNRPDAVPRCIELVRGSPAWVFMGDNYFGNGRLDQCDELVRSHGELILHSAPIAGFTDASNLIGYALYYVRPIGPGG